MRAAQRCAGGAVARGVLCAGGRGEVLRSRARSRRSRRRPRRWRPAACPGPAAAALRERPLVGGGARGRDRLRLAGPGLGQRAAVRALATTLVGQQPSESGGIGLVGMDVEGRGGAQVQRRRDRLARRRRDARADDRLRTLIGGHHEHGRVTPASGRHAGVAQGGDDAEEDGVGRTDLQAVGQEARPRFRDAPATIRPSPLARTIGRVSSRPGTTLASPPEIQGAL